MDPEEIEEKLDKLEEKVTELERMINSLEQDKNELTFPLSPQTTKIISDALSEFGFQRLVIQDGITAPITRSGSASLYIDIADGDYKIEFGDGFGAIIKADS